MGYCSFIIIPCYTFDVRREALRQQLRSHKYCGYDAVDVTQVSSSYRTVFEKRIMLE